MLAQRWIGVIFPARSQPRGSPPAASWPLWTWAATSVDGDVFASVSKPKPASLVGVMPGGAFRFEGSSGQVAKIDGEFGSAFVSDDPTVPNRPASGAGMPPKAIHGGGVGGSWGGVRA